MALPDFTVDRNSTKYVLGSGGDIISYATDEPAIEFNTDGSFKGLLVEPASTNICLQSEDITTSWSPNNATVVANATTAPDGNATADKLNDDSGGGAGYVFVQQSRTITAGTKCTASVFLKADQLAFARLQVDGYDGAASGGQFFGLSGDGSLGTALNLNDSSITKYPDGWYRCSITWTQGAADTSFALLIMLTNSISNITVDRDGTSSIFVWGAQVEEGPIATSYIPTTTASVTRVKDDITQTGASSLIGQGAGTLYVEVDWKRASGTYQYLLAVNDGTANNRILIFHGNGSDLLGFAIAGGSVITVRNESSTGYSGIQKIAFAYADSDFELYRNGSSISSSTSGSLASLATLTDIDLGQAYNATAHANMHIRAVALYKERLSDAQCIALTS